MIAQNAHCTDCGRSAPSLFFDTTRAAEPEKEPRTFDSRHTRRLFHDYAGNDIRARRRRTGQEPRARGGARQFRRRGRRLVRLPAVRHRRGACVQYGVLSAGQPGDGHARRVRDVRRRLPVPSARRLRVRPLRRPHRPQTHAGADRHDDGPVDGADRPAALFRDDRLVGAPAARDPASDPGFRRRRRMGRRRADGVRKRAGEKEGVLQQRRAGRLRRRVDSFDGSCLDYQPLDGQRELPRVGLAPAVRVQRRARADRAVDPLQHGGVAGVRRKGRPEKRAKAGCVCRSSKRWCAIRARFC